MLITIEDAGVFELLLQARQRYSEMDFSAARALRDTYIQRDRPQVLKRLNELGASFLTLDAGAEFITSSKQTCRVSFIVVAYNTGSELVHCVESILSQCADTDAEVLVVDNGGNDAQHEQLLALGCTVVHLPCNIGPCEARNVGAAMSRGDLLAFIDDDARLDAGCVKGILTAFDLFDFSAIRGRILPLATAASSLPGHYDLGNYPVPSILETEGAMVVTREVWERTGGMDPMLFGAEGAEFSERVFEAFPEQDIFYWPSFCIRHDYAIGAGVERKLERHRVAKEYFTSYGKAAKHIPQQYGLWYQARPATSIRYDQRSIGQKLKAAVTELLLRKKISPNVAKASETALRRETLPLRAYDKDILIQRLQETERRSELLEQNLETINTSSAYRVGRILAEGYKSPLQTAKRLPAEIASVVKDIFGGNKRKSSAVVVVRESQPSYTHPGREEHRCKIFSPATVTAKPAENGTRLGTIVPSAMFSSLMYDCLCSSPEPDRLEEWFDEFQPDLVLGTPVYDGRSRLQHQLFEEARRRGVPSAFWFTESEAAVGDYTGIMQLADACYAASHDAADSLASVRACGVLPPAVQPALHNPLTLQSDVSYDTGNAVCFDGWADCIEFQEHWTDVLSCLHNVPVHIFESRWSFMANKLNDIPQWKTMIHGCVTPEQLRTIVKHYPLLVQGDRTLCNSFSRATAALEAICAGAAVVSHEENDLFESLYLPKDMYFSAATDNAFAAAVENILSWTDRDVKVQKARRKIYDAHTFSHRIGQLCADLSVPFENTSSPLCTLITPTKRPHLLEECLKRHQNQSYRNIKSIVVLNTTECDVDSVRQLCDRFGSSLIVMSEQYTIGQCLNEAIRRAKGELWFKIDDDDFYGENYVKDTVHSWQMSQAGLFGKPAGFIYFDSDDSLWRRDVSRRRPHYICNTNWPHMSGATFAGSVTNGAMLAFPSMHRACVDSLFFEQTLRDGYLMHMTDHYNFVAYRAADKKQHTWRQQDSDLQRNAEKIGDGNAVSSVMI